MLAAARLCAIDLDPTFGQGGKVVTPFPGPQSSASAVLIQPDNRIVAAGSVGDAFSPRVALARYNSDGSLDPTFGSGGRVVTNAGGVGSYATGLALQPDGKLLVSGVLILVDAPADSSFLVVRYLPDGSLDPSFGAGGIVATDFLAGPGGQDGAKSLTVEPGGNIVAAGFTGVFTNSNAFALARYDSTGGLDPTFGVGGRVVVDMGAGLTDSVNAVALQPNGGVVGCGTYFEFPRNRFALIRLTPDGSLDPTFGSGGRVYTEASPDGSSCQGMGLQSDGKIVAFGGALSDFAVLRYLADGSLDLGFGAGGIALTRFEGSSGANGGAIAADGGIVAAGTAFSGVETDFALAGYLPDGQPDPDFGPTGWLTTDFGGHDGANAMAIQPDGRIVAAGFAGPVDQIQFALARYAGAISGATAPVPALSEAGLLALGVLLAVAGTALLMGFGRTG